MFQQFSLSLSNNDSVWKYGLCFGPYATELSPWSVSGSCVALAWYSTLSLQCITFVHFNKPVMKTFLLSGLGAYTLPEVNFAYLSYLLSEVRGYLTYSTLIKNRYFVLCCKYWCFIHVFCPYLEKILHG